MSLKKPDLNKPAFQIYPTALMRIQAGWCATCSGIIREEDFRDELSKKEYSISGMCQSCQDQIFTGVSTIKA